jgi:RNA polymerase sigma-70 factor (ECF subfamily)
MAAAAADILHRSRMPEPSPQAERADPLGEEEFAARLQADRRRLWTIAAAILGSPHDADDVVQEASVIAMEKLEQFRRGTSFAAWMGQIVRYVALNQRRKRGRDRSVRLDPEGLAPAGCRPGPDAEFNSAVLDAVGDLDEMARTCLLLRIVCDMSYREIASSLDIPEGTAMSHVHRSRKALRERLANWETAGAGLIAGKVVHTDAR